MTKQLTTENATITTVTIEIKALTLSGRQVTLSVFRQLPESDILDIDYSEEDNPVLMNGTPWGTVNYCLPSCPKTKHIHVVWQDSDTLYRSTTNRDAYTEAEIDSELSPEEKRAMREMNKKWHRAYWHLTELPQLFIAV